MNTINIINVFKRFQKYHTVTQPKTQIGDLQP